MPHVIPEQHAVELRKLTVLYKAVTALNAIDLSVREGEFFSLLGPSGCGKTTTLNIIGGFIQPDGGEVLLQGRSVNRMPPYQRPVNTVFQSYALFPHMTVAENVAFGPRMAAMGAAEMTQRTNDALALVSLSGFGARRPDQLSGGQQQRVALARALVNRPSVLLLDEPLGALDLKLRRQMQLELSRIQREVGITFVYVTHDQDEAMMMSDRIAVMNKGRIAQIGTPQEIYERPASLFVADFIGSSNILRGHIVGHEGNKTAVRLDAGNMLSVPRDNALKAQDKVTVVVRPDHMTIYDPPADGPEMNVLDGRVTKVAFLGTHIQVSIAAPGQNDLMLIEPLALRYQDSALPEVGSEVRVSWPAFRSLCFPEAEK